MSQAIERTLPCSVETEKLVLGSILLDGLTYPTVAAGVAADDFSIEAHRRIFRRITDLYTRGEAVDRLTLYEELKRHHEVESCGGLGYLVSLDDGLPKILNLESYVRILAEKAALRRVIFACQNIASRAGVSGENAAEIITAAQEAFSSIGPRGQKVPTVAEIPSVRDCGSTDIEYIRHPELPRGAVVALTGDSGSGKSTLATAWTRDVSVPVLFLDRENPLSAIADRLERLGMIDGDRIRFWGGWLAQEAPQPDAPAVMDWVRTCDPKPLVVVDSFSAFGPVDQNDAGETRAFMHRCRRLADLGATVVVIHHDGKADTAKDYRGSSDFKAAIDSGYHVTNFGDGQLDKMALRPFKNRFGHAGQIMYDYAGGRFTRCDEHNARQTVTEQMTALLRLNPGVTGKAFEDLASKHNLGRNVARRFLGDGVLAGSIRFETGAKNMRRYSVAAVETEDAPDWVLAD
ncbi:MAG TPA: DnaB-like helicase N-terminal domain-containing protein [Clostridia bacterium]|nr:DnaB-like helicase N-terminal domain-containing protein [Clostridia bacterium]